MVERWRTDWIVFGGQGSAIDDLCRPLAEQERTVDSNRRPKGSLTSGQGTFQSNTILSDRFDSTKRNAEFSIGLVKTMVGDAFSFDLLPISRAWHQRIPIWAVRQPLRISSAHYERFRVRSRHLEWVSLFEEYLVKRWCSHWCRSTAMHWFQTCGVNTRTR